MVEGQIEGYAPTLQVKPIESIKPINTATPIRPAERDIYRALWESEEYRRRSPGEKAAPLFLALARPKPGASVLDLGCGTGRGGAFLAGVGMDVTLVDFADNCLDPGITLPFVEADMTQPLPVAAEYGFCVDVMEHIPKADVDAVLDNCLRAAQHCFFQIALDEDTFGAMIGHRLHVTLQPYEWWMAKFVSRGCKIHWSDCKPGEFGHTLGRCVFHVSAWADGSDVVAIGVLNTEEETVKANVRANIAEGWQQVSPHVTSDDEVMIVGGGPSLPKFLGEIRRKRARGSKLVTLNGAYNWALEKGLTPSATVVVDARPFNARFTKPVVDGCKYLIASQCDPSVLEGLPQDRTYLWHTSAEMIREDLDQAYGVWWGIPGGSTVLLRALPLLRMLGFQKYILYGCDSCLAPSQPSPNRGGPLEELHHAYAQAENDEKLVIPVTVGGRVFPCYPWMISQAQEFMDLIKVFGDEIKLQVRGDGLLSHILQTGATMADMEAAAITA